MIYRRVQEWREYAGGPTVTAGCRYFRYDSLSRLTESVQPESGKVSYSYDAVDSLKQRTDARGLVTSYDYDALNRMNERRYTDSTPTVDYTYDSRSVSNAKELLTIVANVSSVTNYLNYDLIGDVLSRAECQSWCAFV
jgi:YD repeat-containing protein